MNEIEFIKSMEVLEVKKGDVLVVKMDSYVPLETSVKIEKIVKEKLPTKIKEMVTVFVLTPDVDMGILRAA